jgi:DNA-binding FrmR family transcriptional regulator
MLMRKRHMLPEAKAEALKRLNYIQGHLEGVRRMVEEEKYCVDVMKQLFAVRRATEKLEALLLDGHLHTCVATGIRENRDQEVLQELLDLYTLANR